MSKPISLGIAGLGRAGWGMQCQELASRQDYFTIVAGCDTARDRRERFASKYPAARVYSKIEDMIADPNVELVSVATRSPDHFAHASMALKAGKHVLVEKPMCIDYEQARKLQTIAARSKGRLFVRHNRRWEPGFNHIREIIASGILGNVFQISLARVGYARRDDWQTIVGCGGGQLLNWGPHIVDHALQFLESPVKSMWSELRRVACAGDAEDHLRIILTGQNGRTVDLEISGGCAIGKPEYFVLGTRGALTSSGNSITMRYLDPKVRLLRRKANPRNPGDTFGTPETLPWIETTIPVKPGDMSEIWDDLYRALRLGKEFRVSLQDAVNVMKVISAAKKGTPFEYKSGRPARG